MILVTGAAGKTGRAVIEALASRKALVRALVRSQEQVASVKAAGALEVILGDMRDPATLLPAAKGARAIYHICPNMHAQELDIGKAVIRVAQKADVAHFVYHSVLHPQVEAMPHHWHKMRVEEMLFRSGLGFTILQPAAYMQNILAGWQMIVGNGRYRVPYSLDARLAMVDLLDVAEVAAVVLTEPGHRFAIYELSGPENLSQTQVAAILSDVLDRPVRVEQVPIDEWRQSAERNGLASSEIEMLSKMFDYYDQYGLVGSSWLLQHLLSRPPTNFDTFARRVASGQPGEA